jgi:hypothetical protein
MLEVCYEGQIVSNLLGPFRANIVVPNGQRKYAHHKFILRMFRTLKLPSAEAM